MNVPFLMIADLLTYNSTSTGEEVDQCNHQVKGSLWKEIFVISHVVLFFILPFIMLGFVYGKIMHSLIVKNDNFLVNGRRLGEHAVRMRKQVVIMLIAIVVLFFVCLTPFRVITVWFVYVSNESFTALGLKSIYNIVYGTRIMYIINSAGNPILYNIFSSKFRRAFRNLICPRHGRMGPPFSTSTMNGSMGVHLVEKPKLRQSVSSTTTATMLSQNISTA